MKKIPTLFERVFEGRRIVGVTDKVYPGMEWVLEGKGEATLKLDGSCCAIIDGVFYKRYDAKKGKKPPEGAIPCCAPDPVTGHWPHWVRVTDGPEDRWFREAHKNSGHERDGTYEAVGPHFQGNPYKLPIDTMYMHGFHVLTDVPRSLPGIQRYLDENKIEGIVFWLDGEPMCKIKRSDFGFEWNGR